MKGAGVIICGGRSKRMGRDKALLPWRGRPMISHLVAVLRAVVDEVIVVNSRDLVLPKLDAVVVQDRVPGLGPLGGIREALHAIRSDFAVIASTDAPNLSVEFVEFLLSQNRTAACRFGGVVQPLPAIYSRDLAAVADDLIESDRMRRVSLQSLLEAGGYHEIAQDELEQTEVFRGFNSSAEYLAAVRESGEIGRVEIELSDRISRRIAGNSASTSFGLLRDVLATLEPEFRCCDGGTLDPNIEVRLNGVEELRDLDVPIGPGEHITIQARD